MLSDSDYLMLRLLTANSAPTVSPVAFPTTILPSVSPPSTLWAQQPQQFGSHLPHIFSQTDYFYQNSTLANLLSPNVVQDQQSPLLKVLQLQLLLQQQQQHQQLQQQQKQQLELAAEKFSPNLESLLAILTSTQQQNFSKSSPSLNLPLFTSQKSEFCPELLFSSANLADSTQLNRSTSRSVGDVSNSSASTSRNSTPPQQQQQQQLAATGTVSCETAATIIKVEPTVAQLNGINCRKRSKCHSSGTAEKQPRKQLRQLNQQQRHQELQEQSQKQLRQLDQQLLQPQETSQPGFFSGTSRSPQPGTVAATAVGEIGAPSRKKAKLLKRRLQNQDTVTNSPVSGMFIKEVCTLDELQKAAELDDTASYVHISAESRRKISEIANVIGDSVCSLCKVKFEDVFRLAMHRCPRIIHEEYRCPECEKVFSCPANLASHRRWHRPRSDNSDNNENDNSNLSPSNENRKNGAEFSCANCHDSFPTKKALKSHKKICPNPQANCTTVDNGSQIGNRSQIVSPTITQMQIESSPPFTTVSTSFGTVTTTVAADCDDEEATVDIISDNPPLENAAAAAALISLDFPLKMAGTNKVKKPIKIKSWS